MNTSASILGRAIPRASAPSVRVPVPQPRRAASLVTLAVVGLLSGGCTENTPSEVVRAPDSGLGTCELPSGFLVDSGLGKGGIPTLQNPEFISSEPGPGNTYLKDDDRVLGVMLDGEPLAVPHNILWYHEIVNLDRGGESVAVTYCPLTGSTLGFDRASIGGQELGVSGLLFMNNLIMFNRGEPESLWPQMLGEARCKANVGRRLDRIPLFEMTWRAWRDLYPETQVITSDVNISRNYTLYPYGQYERLDNPAFLFSAMPQLDGRRPAKERVLGLPPIDGGEPGIAFPFGTLEEQPGNWTVVEATWNGADVVVLWADERGGGAVFRPYHPTTGDRLEFRATLQGIEDVTTGTRWSIAGEGIVGELMGQRLDPVADAYVAFWGAWAAFHEGTRLWQGE